MKKLFFFRSNPSNATNNDQSSPPSTDKQVSWEKTTDKSDKPAKNKHGPDDQVLGTTPCLRRSLSFSYGSPFDNEKGQNGNQTGSPCSASYYSNKKSGHHRSSSSCAQTPEKQTRSNKVQNSHRAEKFDCNIFRAQSDLSEISSYCSSNVSNVLDRYIDGEQQMFENGNAVVKRPPRLQFNVPAVSHDGRKQKPKSQSFRETKSSSKDWADSGYCNGSPRKLAKDVVERLSQSQYLHKMKSQEFDNHDNPITIEDIYGKTFNRCSDSYEEASRKKCSTDWQAETSHEEISEKDNFAGDADIELYKKFKEAEDRATILSEEFKKGNFPFQYRELSVPALLQTIRTLTEEKVNMALEVSSVLEDMLAEKAFYKEKLKLGKVELDSRTRKLEKEKNELQVSLEKELDRRSIEWSHKHEKLRAEESRLRERVRELAEQNVYLQREVSSSGEREMDVRSKITLLEKQHTDLSIQAKDAMEENRYLQKTLSEVQEKVRAAEEERDCIRRSHEEKVTECKDMHRSISRLQRTCSDQEKTIDGLRGLCEALGKKLSQEQFDFGTTKLQAEHMRLTGVEHALRKEVESCRGEVDSLRRENIDLLNRLRNDGKEGAFLTFKLDRELENRVGCLESQIVPLLVQSNQLGRKLIECVKGNGGFIVKNGHGCLDGQVIIECEVKLQGLERAAENVTNSLWSISSVLKEKTTPRLDDESQKRNEQKSEDINRSALKAETLLTNLLREKLYSKEMDLEQMQAELAAAVRGNDVLKCELQNAVDNCSCINHKMKETELQMMKKEETVNQLQSDLQECKKELAVVRGILPKVSEERDMMWDQVKQYSEKNMLLSSEINVLRKKIDTLDEDILVKEGQITILKDSLGKPFDLLASPESIDDFYRRDKR
ncbi:hypothetical protein CASFOL_000253 [Castilleja foliolosa]|uniref:DUF7653 domain-containing protein n=1 Tax=Castilleja foliolosa TaxID=1961234 RepID=A0ABD3ENP9_9LAMI